MSGRLLLIPLALVVTAALALVITWTDGARLEAELAQRSGTPAAAPPAQPAIAAEGAEGGDAKRELQAEIDQLLAAEPITFTPDTAELTAESEQTVSRIREVLAKAPADATFEVGGHVAKTPGDEESGLELSRQRAEAVAKLVAGEAVPAERITAKGYGDTRPKAGGGDDRRVEITVK
ncbi:OmpA family protein [Amycolatopsis sp. 195334CR]|uniref:OmpA family protein n=1 Tax=Amycolatopsis sp. 195334CR TaxID=2814588 RepID=UPI001A8C2624|nr:OmpA family protein [Amycolatopsis sp. 195334CR]MBN6034974.1 OmpA family protein [Amycolatopsis sp. 195334CR]